MPSACRLTFPLKKFIYYLFTLGVDLNRNYDAEWMNAGSSQNKCSSVYAGSAAFSEPESQAHRDDMLAMTNKMGKHSL